MARPTSKHQAIFDKIKEQLEKINPENGYDHDLRGKVFYGRSIYGAEQDVPFVSVLEQPKPNDVSAAGSGKVRRTIFNDLMIQGFVKDNKENPLVPALDLLAEVELCLSELISEHEGRPTHPTSHRLANLATDVLIGQGIARPPTEKVSPTAFFYLPAQVKWTLDLTKPFVE